MGLEAKERTAVYPILHKEKRPSCQNNSFSTYLRVGKYPHMILSKPIDEYMTKTCVPGRSESIYRAALLSFD